MLDPDRNSHPQMLWVGLNSAGIHAVYGRIFTVFWHAVNL